MDLDEPYVGPKAFERRDQNRFFGRDREANQLRALITAHPVVLLYARSGAGKSSLLNAKLVPMLEGDEFYVFPTARVRPMSEGASLGDETNFYAYNALHSLEADAGVRDFIYTTLDEYLLQQKPSNKAGEQVPKVFILDQFEEFFTVAEERWRDREPFMEQLGFALQEDPLLRVVLAMREDHIAKLDPYVSLLPGRLRKRFRIELLREEAALDAVEGPLKNGNWWFAPGVAQRLVLNLLELRGGLDSSGHQGEFVEPVHLQVVCQSLWRSIQKSGVKEITDDHLIRFGDVRQVLASFYDDAIRQVVQQGSRVREGRLRHWFEEELITPEGTRNSVRRTLTETAGLPNLVVDDLERERLIVTELRNGSRWYELAHERLIDAVHEANEHWRGSLGKEVEVWRRIKARAAEWLSAGRPWGLLLKGELLEEAEEWLAGPFAEEMGYSESIRRLIAESRLHSAEVPGTRFWAGRSWRVRSAAAGVAVALMLLVVLVLVRIGQGDRRPRSEDGTATMEALKALRDQLGALQRSENRLGEAETLMRIAQANERLRNLDAALAAYARALALYRELQDTARQRRVLGNIANLQVELGQMPEASETLNKALKISRSVKDLQAESVYLHKIGEIELRLGRARVARELLLTSLLLAKKLQYEPAEVDAALLAGLASFEIGLLEPAFDLISDSLAGAKRAGDSSKTGIALAGFGQLLLKLGAADVALDYLSQEELPETADEVAKARFLFRQGWAFEYLGRDIQARQSYMSSLALLRSSPGQHWSEETRLLAGMGRIASKQNRNADARRLLVDAVDLGERAVDHRALAEALLALGDLQRIEGEPAQALDSFSRALVLNRELGNPWEEIETLRRKATAESELNRIHQALSSIRSAVELGERIQSSVRRVDLRRHVAAWLDEDYDLLVEILVRCHERNPAGPYLEEAFRASERSREPTLLYLLAREHVDRVGKAERVNPSLLRRRQELQIRIRAATQGSFALETALGEDRAQSLARIGLDTLLREFWEIEARIRDARNSGAVSLGSLGLDEVRVKLLDSETVLLEYHLGKHASYLFLVAPEGAAVFRLPEAAILTKSAYAFLRMVSDRGRSSSPVTKAAGVKLGQLLLAPASNWIQNRRLLIVADGVLRSVPFAALPDPTAADPRHQYPLIQGHAIAYGPSATVLALLEDRQRRRSEGAGIAILADPVLSGTDLRLPKRLGDEEEAIRPGGWTRMLGTATEAKSIARLGFPRPVRSATGFDASRDLVVGPLLAGFRILHFAVPAEIDKRAELSRLLLSHFDSQGEAQEGTVWAHELFSRKLSADLVVLSGGRIPFDSDGEGLREAFLSAGAASLVGSSWSGEDRSTAELMIHFYRNLLHGEGGPPAALRKAQLDLMATERWHAPFHWAGFRVEGRR